MKKSKDYMEQCHDYLKQSHMYFSFSKQYYRLTKGGYGSSIIGYVFFGKYNGPVERVHKDRNYAIVVLDVFLNSRVYPAEYAYGKIDITDAYYDLPEDYRNLIPVGFVETVSF